MGEKGDTAAPAKGKLWHTAVPKQRVLCLQGTLCPPESLPSEQVNPTTTISSQGVLGAREPRHRELVGRKVTFDRQVRVTQTRILYRGYKYKLILMFFNFILRI